MAKHLDLEEQEQLDELKHFWKQYGNLITWALIAILGTFAAWNGYNYWQRDQSAKAALMYDEVERAAVSGEVERLDRSLADMKERFARTAFAQQAGLLAAKVYYDKGNIDSAKASLAWVAGKSADEGYQAIARLRLAGLLLEAKAYADRRGDILAAQGKRVEARAEYEKAFKAMDERAEYRRLVEVKLNALGAALPGPATATSVPSSTKPEVKP